MAIPNIGKLIAVAAGVVAAFGCSAGGSTGAISDAADAGDPLADSGQWDQHGAGISFATDVYPIVASSCALSGCHDTSTNQNHWTDFSTPARTYMRWVNGLGFDFCTDDTTVPFVQRPIVAPGDPEASYVVMKIAPRTDEPCQDPTHSRRMPPSPRPPLAPAQIETIITWIGEGAAQN